MLWKCKCDDDARIGNKDGVGGSLKRRSKKRKGKKDLNVLSFGGEMEDVDEGLDGSVGMKSSHELASKGTSSENNRAVSNRERLNLIH